MVTSKRRHVLRRPALLLSLALIAVALPLGTPAQADHPAQSCLDLDPETATADVGTTQTITATIREIVPPANASGSCVGAEKPVASAQGLILNFEITGPNDPDASNSPQTPDGECTIPTTQTKCTFLVQGSVVGTDTIRGWVNHDRTQSTFAGEADTTEGRNELTAPGNGDTICVGGTPAEPDCTDVVERTWSSGSPTLDCDDAGQPDTEREINPGDQSTASNEVYTCTARDATGATQNNISVRGEVENGINDPDPNDDASYGSPDYACTTGSNGTCTITVAQSEAEQGTAIICFWRNDQVPGGGVGALCGPPPPPSPDPEPTGENQLPDGSDVGNDAADQVEKTWQQRSAATGGVDAEPEAATNPVGSTHSITATVYDQFGDPFVGNTQVNFEWFTGSPGDTGDGNDPTPADRTCTTQNSSSCRVEYVANTAGTDLVCVWTNTDPNMQGTNNDGTCDGEALNDTDDAAGTPDSPEPPNDNQDVVQKTWRDPNQPARIDCTPEIASNAPGTAHTVTCTVNTLSGQSATAGAVVDVEATGENDPDGTNSMTTPDFTCTTNASSQCSFTHGPGGTGTTSQPGRTSYRAWIDSDNNNTTVEADETEGRDETAARGLEAEPDDTDVVEKNWGGEGRTIDCSPESASNPTGTTHTVSCTVRDRTGDPVSGEGVTFTETGAGTLNSQSQQTTTALGNVQVTATSQETGAQTITATLSDDLSGNEPSDVDDCDRAANDPSGSTAGVCSDSVSKTWTTPPPPGVECDDNVDNDGDGDTDFPDDAGCESDTDDSESPDPQCADGRDNDNDNKVDFPDDPGCDSQRDNNEFNRQRPKRVSTTVRKFRHGSPFRGDLEASKRKCERGRRVVVRKVKPGRDDAIGRDRSNRSGAFRVGHRGEQHGDGRFYAKVKKKKFTNRAGRTVICQSERSRTIRVR